MIPLTIEQLDVANGVYAKAVQTGLGTLGGYAGTGKSTILAHLQESLDGWAFMAYTGKAAENLRRKGVRAKTIHSVIYSAHGEPPRLLHATKLDVKSKLWEHTRRIDNVTKWIIDSEIILPDCITLDIKRVEPFLIDDAMDLGVWHRRRDKRLTKTFLRTVLNNRKAKP